MNKDNEFNNETELDKQKELESEYSNEIKVEEALLIDTTNEKKLETDKNFNLLLKEKEASDTEENKIELKSSELINDKVEDNGVSEKNMSEAEESISEKKTCKAKKTRIRNKGLLIFGGIVSIVLIFIIIMNYLIKTNEDIEAKILGNKNGVNWSENIDEPTKYVDDFNKVMKLNSDKYKENIIIMQQHNGCGACFETILNDLNSNLELINKNNLGIVLITTMHEDDIEQVYSEKTKDITVISDYEYEIGKKLKIYNEEDGENEDLVIFIKDKGKEDVEEYYYEKPEEVIEYIKSIL